MRVHFINRFYWPAETATAQLLTDLAESLAARGWSVAVVTGHSRPGLPACESRNGVEIRRTGPCMAATQSLARRALDFLFFHLGVLPLLWRALRQNDIAVALTDPPLIGISVGLVAGLRKAHTVHWVQDIYPEVVPAVRGSVMARTLCALLREPRDIAWRRSAACVSLSREMAAHIQSAGVGAAKSPVVSNWAPRGIRPAEDDAVHALRSQWELAGRFVIGYSGNFGRVHDLGHILDVAEKLRDDPRFLFLFIGNGAAFEPLRKGVASRRLTNVRFLPARPREELSTSLGAADVHLISVREGCERFVFPSKLYGIAAAGRPILLLASLESEIARTIRDHGLGLVFRPNDVDGIVGGLKKLSSDSSLQDKFSRAALAFDSQHRHESAVHAWENILTAATGMVGPRDAMARGQTSRNLA